MSIPRHGIYHGLPFADYLAVDAISNSALALFKKSPRHYRHSPPQEETSAMALGTITHAAVLTPLEVIATYVVMPNYATDPNNQTADGSPTTSRTKWVRDKEAEFKAMHQGKVFVAAKDYDAMMLMAKSIADCPEARDLLQGKGSSEVTIVWQDDETGLTCKGRIDRLCQPRLGDLKTSVDLKKFRHSLRDFGYYRQMAYYVDGFARLTGEVLEPWIVAVEKSPPYCVQCAPVDAETLEYGRREYRRLLRELADCLESDTWPGPPSPESWRLPDWAMQEEGDVELVVGNQTVRL